MAGVKGKSGGPRPDSGGTRAGAGRKPKATPAKISKWSGLKVIAGKFGKAAMTPTAEAGNRYLLTCKE